MKKFLLLTIFVACVAHAADSPSAITMPNEPPADSGSQNGDAPAPKAPISSTVADPNDKNWKEYDNHIVGVHVRVRSSWPVIEIKETRTTGTFTFTVSHYPLSTFLVTKDTLQDNFDTYMSSSALTPIYPDGYRTSHSTFAGRKAVVIRGVATDGRQDESYFIADGQTFYRISLTAPKEYWGEAGKAFAELKESFRWLKQ